ncbi:hypothetical protein EGW08_013561 [Elysia chlorotica]|uniref:Uncharacterized protein n=1 Tax=Elysia chlorotica TaxID=188477 RepID=A0A433TAP7_ELYCH|nr:hypothetical protein EGW08_013561 [Elysia chlorotica]
MYWQLCLRALARTIIRSDRKESTSQFRRLTVVIPAQSLDLWKFSGWLTISGLYKTQPCAESGKLLTKKNEIENFMSQLDSSSSKQVLLPAGLTQRERALYKKLVQCTGMTSIPLAEFDRLWKQKASHSRHRAGHKPVAMTMPTRGIAASHPDVRRRTRLVQSDAQEYHGEGMMGEASLVVSRDIELCLPMNRQKHAVRDVWSRITSEDVRHKTTLKKAASASNLTTQSQQAPKSLIRQENLEHSQAYRTQAKKAVSDRSYKRH